MTLTTQTTAPLSAEGGKQLCLLVIADGQFSTHPLPAKGSVTIGRSQSADVSIEVSSVSRAHAVLHMGEVIKLEDLGSSNGTTVRDAVVAPNGTVDIALGDSVGLGTATLVVHNALIRGRPRRIWSHDYFEARLEDECERATRTRTQFVLARLHLAGGIDGGALEQQLGQLLRRGDLLAAYAPNEYEMLIVDAVHKESGEMLARMRSQLEQHGAKIHIGVAHFPEDGYAPETLMSTACNKLLHRTKRDFNAPIVWQSDAMQRLHQLVERVARGNIGVLVVGETGVGKEVFAERIHALSPRKEKPLVRLNCAAFSPSLLESELFGHEKGAFTGATRAKAGLLETADGGTVFLDEIGDMPAPLQPKLLRVVEDGKLMRVGAVEPRSIDVRFIAATHKNLELAMARGSFRQDLFYRLNGVTIVIPPLRDRLGEVGALAHAFIEQASKELGQKECPSLSDGAKALLAEYQWPGNIRELRNVMERAVLLCTRGQIREHHLPVDKMRGSRSLLAPVEGTEFEKQAAAPEPEESKTNGRSPERAPPLPEDLRDYERKRLTAALQRCNNNQTLAARYLGIARRTLISKMEKHGIARPRKDKPSAEE